MITTVTYLHPDRALRATWSIENGDATLTAFEENAGVANAEVVVHSSKILFHRYPVDADEEHERRRFFEIITCLPPLEADDHIIDVPMPGLLHGSKWHGLMVVPKSAAPEGVQPVDLHVDILEDIRATRISGLIAESGITMLIGRRGLMWWCAVLDASGTTLHLVQAPVHELFEDAGEVRDLVLEVCGSMDLRAERVVLFGDTLTKSMLEDTMVTLQDLAVSVVRLNPFRTLSATVDAATQQRCIRLAHLLGPLVGPLPLPALQEQS